MKFYIESLKRVEGDYVYLKGHYSDHGIGPNYTVELKLPVSGLLTYLQTAFNTTIAEEAFKLQPTIYNRYLEGLEVKIDPAEDGDSDPTTVFSPTISSPPVEIKNQDVDWPAPEQTSPFTPIRVPYSSIGSKGWRIGYAVIEAPITMSTISRNTYVKEVGSLRSKGSLKTTQGQSYESYNISYVAKGTYEIDRYIKEVIEQIMVNPFVCCEGDIFGQGDEPGFIPTNELAIRSFSITTLPENPGAIMMQIHADPFLWNHWMPPTETQEDVIGRVQLDDAICYPLYKLWCKKAQRSKFDYQLHLNGIFNIFLPSQQSLEQLSNISQVNPAEITQQSGLADAMMHLYNGKLESVGSDILKEIGTTTEDRYFVIKVSDEKLFSRLTGYDKVDGDYIRVRDSALFAGMVEWNSVGYRFADQNGERISSTALIDEAGLPDAARSLSKDVFGVEDFVEVQPLDNLNASLIQALTSKYTAILSRTLEEPELSEQVTELVSNEIGVLADQPFQKYAIVLRVRPDQEGEYFKVVKEIQTITDSEDFIPDISDKFRQVIRDYGEEPLVAIDAQGSRDDIIIEQISATKSHNIVANSIKSNPLPIHQYLGSMGTVLTIQGTVFGNKAKQTLQNMKEHFDNQALKKQSSQQSPKYAKSMIEANRYGTVSPFLRIENEIADLMGIEFVMPVTLTFETKDGQPGAYSYQLTMIEYDPELKREEQIKLLNTYGQANQVTSKHFSDGSGDNTHPIMLKALDYFSLQGALKGYSVYPDLDLPTRDEVNRWIRTIKEIAVIKEEEPDRELTPHQRNVWEVVRQFFHPYFPENQYMMARWNTTNLKGGLYSDPDFYIYYAAIDSFGNTLDRIATETLGERVGLSGDPSTISTSYRWIEPDVGITSVVTPEHVGASEQTAATHLESMVMNTYNSYSGQAVPELFEMEDRVAKERVERGGAIGWWVSGSEALEYGELKVTPISADLLLNPYNAIIPFDATAEGDKVKDGLQAEDLLISEFKPEFQDFFRVMWRLEQIRVFAAFGRNTPQDLNLPVDRFSEGNFLLPVGDKDPEVWYRAATPFKGGSAELWYFHPQSLKYPVPQYSYKWKGKLIPLDSIGDYTTYVQRNLGSHGFKKNPKEVDLTLEATVPENTTNGVLGIEYEPHLTTALSFLERVAIRNSALEARGKKQNIKPGWDSNQTEITRIAHYNQEMFHFYAIKYGVDPNIIQSFFLVRSGLGTFKSRDNVALRGWGDLDTGRLGIGDGPDDAIDAFCKAYRRYVDKYKSPTLAIIATDVYLTDKYNKVDQELLDNVLSDAARATRENQPAEFRKAIRNLPIPGELYDVYYVAWVECNRVLGTIVSPYITSEQDAYYSIYNPFIVLDIGRNLNGRTFSTAETPSGTPQLIRAARNILATNLYNTLSSNDAERLTPDISAETQLLLNSRQRSALSPVSQDAVWGMLHDLRKYSPYGRLVGAYPSYVLIVTNEGFFWQAGHERLWDQFYTRTAVSSIEIFKSRKDPAHTATVSFSNVFHLLTRYTALEAFLQDQVAANKELLARILKNPIQSISDAWTEFIAKDVTDDLKTRWKNNFLNMFVLTPGARLHIRMGYGSDASKLPVVFNGSIVETPVGDDMVNIVAVSDGHELNKNSVNNLQKTQQGWMYQDGGPVFGAGKSPSNIVTDALVNVEGFEAFLSKISGGRLGRDFSHGIAHFGDVYFDGFVHYPTEVQINLYDSNLTHLEQGIRAVQELYRAMAFYTWNRSEDNWFSVSVKEPTPWKVIHTCRRACLDFVASAEPIMMQSTVFFGKWWWPFNYAFKASILDSNLSLRYSAQARLNNPVEDKHQIDQYIVEPKTSADPVTFFDGATGLGPAFPGSQTTLTSVVRNGSRKVVDKHLETVTNWIRTSKNFNENIAGMIKHRKVYSVASFDSDILTDDFQLIFDRDPEAKIGFQENTRYFYFAVGPLDSQEPTEIWKTKVTYIASEFGFLGDVATTVFSPPLGILFGDDVLGIGANLGGAGEVMTSVLPYRDDIFKRILALDSTRADINSFQGGQLDLFKDVDFLVGHMAWKPFTQFYLVNSNLNIISSNIEASADQVYTDAMGIHTYNGWLSSDAVEKTSTWCIDDDIVPSSRKTMLVDTGLYVTALQGSWKNLLKRVAQNTGGLLGSFVPGINELIEAIPPTPGVENSVVMSLVDSVKEMYQGWITITGTPSIKPMDILTYSDRNLGLNGPLGVKEVVHRFDSQTGFITMISPDCVAVPQSCFQGSRILQAVHGSTLVQVGAIWAMRQSFTVMKYGLKKFYGTEGPERLFKQMVLDIARNRTGGDAFSGLSDELRKATVTLKRYQESLQAGVGLTGSSDLADMFKRIEYLTDITSGALEDSDINRVLSELKKLKEQTQQLVDAGTLDPQYANLFDHILPPEKLARFKARRDLALRIKEHEKYLVEWREGIMEDAFDSGLLNGKEYNSTIDAINDLEAKEWERFYDSNKALFETAKYNTISSSEVVSQLKARRNVLIAQRLTGTGNSIKIAKELADIDDMIKQMNAVDIEISVEDIKILRQLLRASLGEVWSPTLKDVSILQELYKNHKAWGTVLGGAGTVTTEILTELVGGPGNLVNLLNRLKDPSEVAVDVSATGKTKGLVGKTAQRLRDAKNAVKGLKNGLPPEEAFKAFRLAEDVEDKLKFAKIIEHLGKSTKRAINVARIAGYSTPVTAVISVIKDVLMFVMGSSLVDGINHMTKARQIAKIYPLTNNGIPFVAGVRGHAGLVVGDDPGWLDREISKWLGGKPVPGQPTEYGMVITSTLAGLFGIEVPDFYPNPSDIAYVESLEQQP